MNDAHFHVWQYAVGSGGKLVQPGKQATPTRFTTNGDGVDWIIWEERRTGDLLGRALRVQSCDLDCPQVYDWQRVRHWKLSLSLGYATTAKESDAWERAGEHFHQCDGYLTDPTFNIEWDGTYCLDPDNCYDRSCLDGEDDGTDNVG